MALCKRVTLLVLFGLITLTNAFLLADSGEQLFSTNCAGCHGKNGDGKTTYAKKVPTPDLRSKEVQGRSNEELYAMVARGAGHVNYPHGYELRGMSKESIQALIQYVKKLK